MKDLWTTLTALAIELVRLAICVAAGILFVGLIFQLASR